MADNYLEKRMADYQAGKLAGNKMTRAAMPHGAISVHVDGPDCRRLVEALRNLGMKVSFNGPDSNVGRLIAQHTGSTFCPMPLPEAVVYMARQRGSIDAVVITGQMPSSLSWQASTIFYCDEPTDQGHYISSAVPVDEAARLVLALAKVSSPLRIEVKSSSK